MWGNCQLRLVKEMPKKDKNRHLRWQISIFIVLFHNFHHFSAAAGDDFAGFYIQHFVTDGAVDRTVLFCPGNQLSKSFCFHCLPPHNL